jgi:L-lysine exporter family protein LysE/ArgO
MIGVAAAGFSLGLSLILPIGAQNSFVLRQGLRREHVFLVCLLCALSDAVLMMAGVFGLAAVLTGLPWLALGMRGFGVVFLTWYGLKSFRRALKDGEQLMPGHGEAQPLGKTLLVCAALTWLNPHVYLDTVLLIGSIGQQYPGHQADFVAGTMAASWVFFFGLGYGAAFLRPILSKPISWRILEALIGLCMWSIAASLAAEFLRA